MGTLESSWKRERNKVIWKVEIPPGAKAYLSIPGELLRVDGDGIQQEPGVVLTDENRLVLEACNYQIICQIDKG